jgi:nitroreductase
MEFFDVVSQRHSIRAYDARPVEPEKLQRILESINRAPSAGNLQGFEVYMVCDEAHKNALVESTGDQDFLAQAPVVLVFCANASRSAVKYAERGASLYCIQDASIACTFAMLAATAQGLSTVWVGAFDEEPVRLAIGAPLEHRPVAMLPVGYGTGEPRIRERRSLNDIVHRVA